MVNFFNKNSAITELKMSSSMSREVEENEQCKSNYTWSWFYALDLIVSTTEKSKTYEYIEENGIRMFNVLLHSQKWHTRTLTQKSSRSQSQNSYFAKESFISFRNYSWLSSETSFIFIYMGLLSTILKCQYQGNTI